MPPSGEKDCRPRVVVDTSVVVAGISGFKRQALERVNFNAQLLRKWIEGGHFVWLYSEDILDEYRYVLAKRGVSKSVIGRLVNLLKEEGEEICVKRYDSVSPHTGDNAFCGCAKAGNANYIVTNNVKHFPQQAIRARVISPDSVALGTWPTQLAISEVHLLFGMSASKHRW